MKSNKKGFTIVELVIVIAIIAILAAVLIPTFASLVKKANVSADTQLVRNLNMAVEIEKASSSAKHETMHDALMTAQDAGYDVDTIVAKSGYNIAWDSANDRFVLVDKDAKKYIYPTSENTAENSISNPADYFLFCDDATKISEDNSGFSYYLSKNAKLPTDGTVTVKAGFDAGENKNLKEVTYNGSATKVIFNLNGGKLTVNDKTDSNQQYFYGFAAEADITTGNSCFHAYGTIAKLDLQAGTVIAKKNSILVVDSAAEGSKVQKDGGIVMAAAGKTFDQNSNVQISTSDEMNAFALEISDAAGLAAFRDSVNSGMTYEGLTVKLTADIDLSTQGNWNPIGNRYALDDNGNPVDTNDPNGANTQYRKAFMGTFDGQGHTISGLFINSNAENYKAPKAAPSAGAANTNTSSYAALFGYVDNATVQNFTVNGTVLGTDVAGVIGILGEGCLVDGIVSNVTVGGKTGENEKQLLRGKAGGIINMTKGGNSTIKNCINNGEVRSDKANNAENRGDYAGGIIALIQHDNITIENCKNTGAVTTKNYHVGGIVGGASVDKKDPKFEVKINNCDNTGSITLTDPKNNDNGQPDYSVGAIIGVCGASSAVSINSCTNAEAATITGGTTYDEGSLVGADWPSDNGVHVTGVTPRKSN